MSAKVGIIIPNYNHSRYLTERIESVLGQTYQDFDLIILDDKSTDNSIDVIEKYRNDRHVKQIVYNEVNSGSSFIQWNRGINTADNELIWIAESDDICDNTLLATLVAEFDRDPECVLAFSDSAFVDTTGAIIDSAEQQETVRMTGDEFISSYLYRANTVKNASSALFKRKAALKAGQDYTNYRGAGDWLFWVEIATQGNIAWVRKPLNFFRQHENTTGRLYSNGTTFKELKRLFSIFEQRGYFKTSLRKHFVKSNMIFLIKRTNFQTASIKEQTIKLFNFSVVDYVFYYLRIIRLKILS